jgi:hypothetical protein
MMPEAKASADRPMGSAKAAATAQGSAGRDRTATAATATARATRPIAQADPAKARRAALGPGPIVDAKKATAENRATARIPIAAVADEDSAAKAKAA